MIFFFYRAVDPHSHVSGRRRASSVGSRTADHLGAIGEDPEDEEGSETETVTSQNTEGNRDGSNFLSRPYWLTDEGLKKGEMDVLSMQEEQFWKDLLEKYLYPIDEDKAEKVTRRYTGALFNFFLNLLNNVKTQTIKNKNG